MKKNLISLSMSIIVGLSAMGVNAAPGDVGDPATKMAVQASNAQLQNQALKLLIYSAVLSKRVGADVEVSPAIDFKYNSIRNSIFASIPVGGLSIGVFVAAKTSAEELQSVLKPINALIAIIKKSIIWSGDQLWASSEALRIDKSIEVSGDVAKSSYNVVKPIVELLVTKGSGSLTLTVSGSSILAGSSFLLSNSRVNNALQNGTVRQLLGYNSELNTKISATVDSLALAFDFDPRSQAVIKEGIYNEVLKQAIDSKFARDGEYEIDVLKILESKNLISSDQALVTSNLQTVIKKATQFKVFKSDDESVLVSNVNSVAALCAVLESLIESGKLPEADEAHARQLLGNATRNLKLVRTNFEFLGK